MTFIVFPQSYLVFYVGYMISMSMALALFLVLLRQVLASKNVKLIAAVPFFSLFAVTCKQNIHNYK